MSRVLLATLGLCLSASTLLGYTATLHYVSEPGDYIGQGLERTYTSADGEFELFRNGDNGVTFGFEHATLGSTYWDVSFAAPNDAELAAGAFPNAQRYPFQAAGFPGLSFTGSGRACNTLTGGFTVNTMIWDLFGVPRRIDADLEQHCEGNPPALFADVIYDFGGMGPLPVGAANLLVTYGNVLYELRTDGTPVAARPILGAMPGGGRSSEDLRDVAVGPGGLVHAFVGTFDPVLSTLTPASGVWRQDTDPSWSIFNNLSYGGIAARGQYVYVADFSGADGVLRFDTAGGYAVSPFDFDQDYIDLALGWDGLLYGLRADENTVDRIDPGTMASAGSAVLAQDVRAVAVNPAGEIFGASWSGTVYRFSAAGAVLDSVAGGLGNLTDIDRDVHGRIAVGAWDPVVGLTDESLASVTPVPVPGAVGFDPTFVAWSSRILATPGLIFADGFELGSTSRWSSVLP